MVYTHLACMLVIFIIIIQMSSVAQLRYVHGVYLSIITLSASDCVTVFLFCLHQTLSGMLAAVMQRMHQWYDQDRGHAVSDKLRIGMSTINCRNTYLPKNNTAYTSSHAQNLKTALSQTQAAEFSISRLRWRWSWNKNLATTSTDRT